MMIALLLVVLAVSAFVAVLIDRRVEEANLRRTYRRFDGFAFNDHQVENRHLLRSVVWLLRYGYLPPGTITKTQRVMVGFLTTLLIGLPLFGAISALVAWVLR